MNERKGAGKTKKEPDVCRGLGVTPGGKRKTPNNVESVKNVHYANPRCMPPDVPL